jgi:hypothetical protein
VLDTYARIKADPRHFALVLISCRSVEEPAFGDWSMAHQNGGTAGEGAGLTETVERLTSSLADSNMRAQFTGFAELHANAA